MENFIFELITMAPPLLLALTFHEFCHGFVADRLGDPTPRLAGRLTLNPLRHLDLVGTLAFFLVKFGWAKPVPVNPAYFRKPKTDMLWVALAGPVSNLVLAMVSALLAKAVWLLAALLPLVGLITTILTLFNAMLITSVWINLILAILNLLPIPPLDGGRILTGLLPDDLSRSFQKLERYGFLLILIFALSGMMSRLIMPIVNFAKRLLLS